MSAQPEDGREPIDLGVFDLPLLLVVGVLAVPVIRVLWVHFKLSERRFVQRMTSLKRVMDWPRFLRSVGE
jgi:hypothetical protein